MSCELYGGLFQHDFSSEKMLFAYMEKILGVRDFAEDRLRAPQLLTAMNPDFPWSFQHDKIYQGLRALPDYELTLLNETLAIVPHAREMLKVGQQAGLKIVAACDGPFPQSFWKPLLAKHGIDFFADIYTSCEQNISKYRYTTFRKILADFNLETPQAYHFGPDHRDDYAVPIDIGMKAHQIMPMSNGLAKSSPLFDAALKALSEKPAHDKDLLLRSMERAALAIREQVHSDQEVKAAMAGICVLGPLLLGFCSWIADWVAFRNGNHILFAAHESSVFARVGSIILRRQFSGCDVTIIPPGQVAEKGVVLRDIDASKAVLVNVDIDGAGAGRLVARNPHLALHPILHFALQGANRHLGREQCYLHVNGIPAERGQLALRVKDITDLLFKEGSENSRLLTAVGWFVIEWSKLQARYKGIGVSRSTVMSLLPIAETLDANELEMAG